MNELIRFSEEKKIVRIVKEEDKDFVLIRIIEKDKEDREVVFRKRYKYNDLRSTMSQLTRVLRRSYLSRKPNRSNEILLGDEKESQISVTRTELIEVCETIKQASQLLL